MHNEQHNAHRSGFTLIEILAVITIISLLMGLIIGVARFALHAARTAKARAGIERIHNALAEYSIEYGVAPDITPSTDATDLPTELAEWLPVGFNYNDPWGHSFQYICSTTQNYIVFSKGVDENSDADDIYSGN